MEIKCSNDRSTITDFANQHVSFSPGTNFIPSHKPGCGAFIEPDPDGRNCDMHIIFFRSCRKVFRNDIEMADLAHEQLY